MPVTLLQARAAGAADGRVHSGPGGNLGAAFKVKVSKFGCPLAGLQHGTLLVIAAVDKPAGESNHIGSCLIPAVTSLHLPGCSVIDAAGVRVWLNSQPVPCSATASDGQLRAVSCRPAHTAAAARQRRQQRGSEAHGVDEDGTLGGMPAAVGEADGDEQLLGSGEGHASDAGDSQLSEERGEQAEAEMNKEAGELAAEGEEEEAEEERWARAEQQAAEEAAAARAARDQAERDEEAELAASEVEQGMQSGSQQQQPAEQQAQEANPAEARQEGAKQEASQEEAAPQGSGPSPYQQALSQCEDLQCLAAAAQQERHPGQFLFPHFFIVGWQVRRGPASDMMPVAFAQLAVRQHSSQAVPKASSRPAASSPSRPQR